MYVCESHGEILEKILKGSSEYENDCVDEDPQIMQFNVFMITVEIISSLEKYCTGLIK